MDMLFLCGVFDYLQEEVISMKSKTGVQNAANKLQWNLIDGFMNIKDLDIQILSAPFIGTYPNGYRDIFFKQAQFKYKNRVEINYIRFNNIWGYRNISRKNNLIKQIKKFTNKKSNEKVIIIYSVHTPFIQAAVHAKIIDPSIQLCLIVPDLPQFMNLREKKSKIYEKLKKIDIKLFNKYINYIDCFVLLTEQMKHKLPINEKPYIVMEGVINIEETNYDRELIKSQKLDNMTIAYTGTLNKKFGIINLLEAFERVEMENVKLILCGRGDSESVIKEYSLKDNRIIYLGELSNKEVIKIQREATILVNPRQNNEEFTKYSFPSKNMEYLLSGRPVIAYKLDGIPDEYDNYFYYVEDDSIESLARKIEEILLLDEDVRSRFGMNARSFVLNNKNNIIASQRIIDMIKNTKNNRNNNNNI